MGASRLNPVDLLLEVIREHSPASKWTGAPLESFRRAANTNRGQIGEDFIRRYLERHGLRAGAGSRIAPVDLTIAGKGFEVKTASEDVGGSYQFNHIRLDRQYDYLLCLGVSPSRIVFNAWRKGVVAENGAGTLVRMAEGQSVTFKLTKRPADMLPIGDLPGWVQAEVLDRGGSSG